MTTNADVTVLNIIYDPEQDIDRWIPTVTRAHWYGKNKTVVNSDGLQAAKMYYVRIPAESMRDSRSGEQATSYAAPVTYNALESKDGYWTVRPGDMIVRGVVMEPANVAGLRDQFDEVMTVLDWHDNLKANNAHLYVEGS